MTATDQTLVRFPNFMAVGPTELGSLTNQTPATSWSWTSNGRPPHETIGQTQPMAYIYHMAEDHVTRENSGSNQELDLNPEMSRASHVGQT